MVEDSVANCGRSCTLWWSPAASGRSVASFFSHFYGSCIPRSLLKTSRLIPHLQIKPQLRHCCPSLLLWSWTVASEQPWVALDRSECTGVSYGVHRVRYFSLCFCVGQVSYRSSWWSNLPRLDRQANRGKSDLQLTFALHVRICSDCLLLCAEIECDVRH